MASDPLENPEALLLRALPKNWASLTKAAVIHAAALARVLFVSMLGEASQQAAANDKDASSACPGCAERDAEIAMLSEEQNLLHDRLGHVPAERRPHHTRPD